MSLPTPATGMFEAVVFDFDGLILDTELPEYTTVRAEFEAHGLTLPLDEWQSIVGRADNRHWLVWLEDELGRSLPNRDEVLERRRAAHHDMIAGNDILPGVLDRLDEAAAGGVAVGIASSSPTSWIEPHLDRLGIRERFDVIVSRDHIEHGKPHPEPYARALEALGADAARSVAFEDSHNGCRAAKAAGMACVVVPNAITRGQDFREADLVLGSLAETTLASLHRLLVAGAAPGVAGGDLR